MDSNNSSPQPGRNILYLSSEVFPYAKTGGLGDVAAALPMALRGLGHDVRIVMPKYGFIGELRNKIHSVNRLNGLEFDIAGRSLNANIKTSALQAKSRVQVYLVECNELFGRQGIYGDPQTGSDYADNDERFILYAQVALEFCRRLSWKPDIIHCNDWQTGLVPAYLKTILGMDEWFAKTRTVFTIHNLAYQGNFPATSFAKAGMPPRVFSLDGGEFFGQFSFLKTGLVYADAITTVSETYAKEIQTEEFGCGMDGLLKQRQQDLVGILNGIDVETWNPETDRNIIRHFSSKELDGKSECKKDLCDEMQLPYRQEAPLIGLVARLSAQKGLDLIEPIIEKVIQAGAQLVVLGSGDKKYEKLFSTLSRTYTEQIAVRIGFNDSLAHKIEAGADIFLMPSQYEPCGLNQMYSMRYGTVPVVRKTGGLADTVLDISESNQTKATGFTFEEYQANALWGALNRAIRTFVADPTTWKSIQLNGMRKDFSWTHSAEAYSNLYEKLLTRS